MPRDVVTIATLLRENITDLQNANNAVKNARVTLERVEADRDAVLERREALKAEFIEADGGNYEKAMRPLDEPSAGDAFDAAAAEARVTEAFERATTPQDQTAIFSNGQSF